MKCERCGKIINGGIEEMVQHVFKECGIPDEIRNDEIERYKYYRRLVDFALNDLLKRIGDGTFDIKGCHLDDFRAFWILLSAGLIKDELFETTPEDAQTILFKYVPEIAIAMMEHAGLVKVEFKNGKVFVMSAEC